MPQSLSKILVHIVFSTKNRRPMLPPDFYEPLRTYAFGICREEKCHLVEMNNVADHVHMLVELHRTEALADLVMHVKKGTSRQLKLESRKFQRFDWQDGYGAFSLGISQRAKAARYIRRQQEHHATVNYQDEFRDLLNRYEIEYDEQYVWD